MINETDSIPGLPRAAVDRWLRTALADLVGDEPWRAEIITGGLSNVTYRLFVAGRSVILRRPPLSGGLPSAHDMAREHHVLSALTQTPVPVPKPLALCRDTDVLGYPFYVMTDVPGVVLRAPEDTAALTPNERHIVADRLVDALVQLHQVEPAAVGLADYGRPDGYCARQIRRWAQQWQRSRTRRLPDMETLFAELAERVPPPQAATIVHGDYRLENTIIDRSVPRIAAILDWELSTLGDPLADLGMLLTYWHDADDDERSLIPVGAYVTNKDGFPPTDAIAESYARRIGFDLSDLDFYRAFAAMKLAVILEGVHARFLGGQTIGTGYETAGSAVPVLVDRALKLVHVNSAGRQPGRAAT